ncbi:MAG: isoleucine--tRNA ligase [Paludibacteraceae bacterium]|nr:isoleucine--tRNA ligase [Paludibacteraceae bacterium]
MSKKFKEYSALNLPQVNREVLQEWEQTDTFRRSVDEKEGHRSFIFFEGPPSANGMPGIHHVLARTIKDIICRYKTMKGFQVKRKAGWDTHGLPVELGVEKTLGITKDDIGKKISVDEYNATCRKEVMKYTREWEKLTKEMGYWVDMTDPYITYDNKYIETLWWMLKQLYNKGLLYKGYTIQPYSPAAGTGLSSHELNQPGCYRDVKDTTVTAQFRLKPTDDDRLPQSLREASQNGTAWMLAWTTTPWTLTSNTALCVGPKLDYAVVKSSNPYNGKEGLFVLAKDLVSAHFGDGKKLPQGEVIDVLKGEELIGLGYEQLIPFFKVDGEAFRVIGGDYVTTEDGTGIVHISPTFGADDARVAKAAGIAPLQLIDKAGNLRPTVDLKGRYYPLEDLDEDYVRTSVNTERYAPYAGRYVKNAYDDSLGADDESLDVSICMMLKQEGLAWRIEKHVHNYPHCWRTDKPILYYPLDSWFIRSTACKDRMMELNRTINWKPESTGSGRFGKWLENLNDWNLSRSRYWGTPLPIWRSETGEETCIGSVEELVSEIEKSVKAGFMTENPYKNFKVGDMSRENYDPHNIDLHRPYIDNVILVSPTGKPMKRESDLIDVWFDSGAMPYAQIHYPFENKELLDSGTCYPADFINEGVDQTRGWFFTLHALATMLFDSVAFKNVISNGLVLDKNGSKMSKRLGNAVNPFEVIEKNGSDPLRWYMITNAAPWDNLKFDIAGVEEVQRKFFGTLYNTYSFFALYANVDGFDGSQKVSDIKDRPEIDRWIVSEVNTLIRNVESALEDYEPTKAGRLIADFVNDNLSNWYVRLNRKRFWGGGLNEDKVSAYETLLTCLDTVARLMAPIAPFFADRLFKDLNAVTGRDTHDSVHLADWPVANDDLIDTELEECMQLAQQSSSMILALRRKADKKVRQPLAKAVIPAPDVKTLKQLQYISELIKTETNVKELEIVPSDAASVQLVKRIKPNFKTLGKKYGKQMKAIASAIAALSQDQIGEIERNERLDLPVDGGTVEVLLGDVEIATEDMPGWLVANEGSLTIALDIEVSEPLRREGVARELVNRIQNLRKTSGLEITDRIRVEIEERPEINDAVTDFKDYIVSQVLASSLELKPGLTNAIELDLDDYVVKVVVNKE